MNLALVGFMGSGKSTVGRAAAQRLELAFVDSDAAVEARAGMPIPDIFARRGEEEFRRLERETLLALCDEQGLLIATGGGAFMQDDVRRKLLETSLVVYLEAPFDVLWERIHGDPHRPLLAGEGAYQRARALFERRRPVYEQAHRRVDAAKSPGQVVEELVEVYHAWRERSAQPRR